MPRRLTTIALILLFCSAAMAGPAGPVSKRYQIANYHDNLYLTNADQVGFAKSGADTFCMISHRPGDAAEVALVWSDPGHPGGNTLNGDFQDDLGLPAWDDWYCVDYTQRDQVIWHCSTYQAISGQSWYVGDETIPSCGGGDPVGGYGNNYDEWLSYYADVADDQAATSINIEFDLRYDNEPAYDYLYLRHETATGYATDATYNGQGSGHFSIPITYSAGEYVTSPSTGNPAIHLQFQGTSDGAYSDADCSFPTTGLAQVDNIAVSGDNGLVPTLETCDPGPMYWEVTFPPGVGAFCYVWPRLDEIDDCCRNDTPQMAFIDNGIVVPGTGGTSCITWCYGPDGWIVNTEGGLAGPELHLHNEVWSPVVAWPAGNYEGAFIEFTVFRHFGLGPIWAGMYYVWHIRSTTSTDPSDIQNESWRDWHFVLYGGPDCVRHSDVVSELLEPGRRYVQMALGIFELGWAWGWNGQDASPAPYFDDARFCAFAFGGPAFRTREMELAQDNFPASGALNCNDPCGMSVRFDAAWDVSLQAEQFCYYGDSLTCDVTALRTGTTLADLPELCYKLSPNPLFDGCRTSGLPNRGCVYGDSARTNGQGNWMTDKFEFDLPDNGFFYPGDMIHYYIRATDTGGSTTTLPGDTSGFSHFPGTGDPNHTMLEYHSSYTVRALPSINDTVLCTHPQKLWWNDFANRGLEPQWMNAWWCVGYEERVDFDIFYTNSPYYGVGNGLGGKAAATQLQGYDMIAYSSGDLARFTITDVDYEDDCGDDIGVLESWFDTGNKCMFLTGNDLVDDLNNRSAATLAWEDKYIRVNLVDTRHDALLGQWNPTVEPVPYPPANPVFVCATRWMVSAYCNPISRYIDLVDNAQGNPGGVAEFLDENCVNNGAYPYHAAVYNFEPSDITNGKVLYLPYDLGWVADDTRCGGNEGTCSTCQVRAEVLRDAIHLCDNTTGGHVIGVPEREKFTYKAYPNPFNPSTKLEYNLAQRGRLAISVYNVRGELVRILIDEVTERGPGFVIWDGNDQTGGAVASGVYFYKIVAGGKTIFDKMALIK